MEIWFKLSWWSRHCALIHLTIYPFVALCANLYKHIYLSIYLFICLAVYVCLSVYICLSIYLFISVYVLACRSIGLSVCLAALTHTHTHNLWVTRELFVCLFGWEIIIVVRSVRISLDSWPSHLWHYSSLFKRQVTSINGTTTTTTWGRCSNAARHLSLQPFIYANIACYQAPVVHTNTHMISSISDDSCVTCNNSVCLCAVSRQRMIDDDDGNKSILFSSSPIESASERASRMAFQWPNKQTDERPRTQKNGRRCAIYTHYLYTTNWLILLITLYYY